MTYIYINKCQLFLGRDTGNYEEFFSIKIGKAVIELEKNTL